LSDQFGIGNFEELKLQAIISLGVAIPNTIFPAMMDTISLDLLERIGIDYSQSMYMLNSFCLIMQAATQKYKKLKTVEATRSLDSCSNEIKRMGKTHIKRPKQLNRLNSNVHKEVEYKIMSKYHSLCQILYLNVYPNLWELSIYIIYRTSYLKNASQISFLEKVVAEVEDAQNLKALDHYDCNLLAQIFRTVAELFSYSYLYNQSFLGLMQHASNFYLLGWKCCMDRHNLFNDIQLHRASLITVYSVLNFFVTYIKSEEMEKSVANFSAIYIQSRNNYIQLIQTEKDEVSQKLLIDLGRLLLPR
jgi:hypothetical protein